MSLVQGFINEYKKTYTYTGQKRMYEKYLEKVKREKAYSKYILFFEVINNLFLRNIRKTDDKILDIHTPEAPDAEEELLNELKKYFQTKKLILFKESAVAVNRLCNPTSDLLWTIKGDAILAGGKRDDVCRAIKCFREAIKLDKGYALAHLGLAIALFKKDKKKEHEEMEKSLKEAEKLGAKAQVAEQYGYMHQQYGEIDKAVLFYEEAIDWDPCTLIALRFLTSYYCDKMQNKKALNILERAKNLMPDEPHINFLKGSVLLKEGERERNFKEAEENLKKARECLEAARDRYSELNDNFYYSLSEVLLKEIEGDTKTRERLQKYENKPVAKILFQTIDKKIDYTVFHNKEKYLHFIAPKLSETVSQDITFEVLRRWNSYTPIIADNYYASRGGGYFIKIKGKGIVVDPGFNFIDNFRETGHKFHEIDAVLITHAHNDHTADLESILTLLDKYNKELKGKETFNRENTVRADMAMFYNKPITCDEKDFEEDCNNEFENRKKTLDLFITKSTMDKYNGMFNLRSDKDYRIHIIEAELRKDQQSKKRNNDQQGKKSNTDGYIIKFEGSKIKIVDADDEACSLIRVIPAKHDDIISDRDSVGFVFEFEDNCVLIITGDTGWNEEIKEKYSSLSEEYKNSKKIILVAHFGGFDPKESKYDPAKAEIQSPPFYKHHLGRLGLASLIEALKPDYCFISEFGEEFKGIRIELVNIFGDVFKDKKTKVILPVDNGFKYDVVKDKAYVITEVDPDSCQKRSDYVALGCVGVGTFYRDYSLQYFYKKSDLCEDDKNTVSESYVMQVSAQDFEKKRF